MKQHQNSIGKTDNWLTPPEIIKALGRFDLDPCDSIESSFKTADNRYTVREDGLSQEWFGRVWLNPPFNRYERGKWMERMAKHNNGIMLIPSALETENAFDHVWGKCSGILFLKNRPHFYYPDGTMAKANSGCTICLVAYGTNNLNYLRHSGLGVTVTEL